MITETRALLSLLFIAVAETPGDPLAPESDNKEEGKQEEKRYLSFLYRRNDPLDTYRTPDKVAERHDDRKPEHGPDKVEQKEGAEPKALHGKVEDRQDPGAIEEFYEQEHEERPRAVDTLEEAEEPLILLLVCREPVRDGEKGPAEVEPDDVRDERPGERE